MKPSKAKKKKDNHCSLAEEAFRLATEIVNSINEKSLQIAGIDERSSCSAVYEEVRKLVVRQLADGCRGSLEFSQLVDAYEYLLDQRLSANAGRYQLVWSKQEKKKRGVFYTPSWLADDLAKLALSPLLGIEYGHAARSDACAKGQESEPLSAQVSVRQMLELSIVDPAMGAGTFLLATAELLADFIARRLIQCNDDNEWNAVSEALADYCGFVGDTAEIRKATLHSLQAMILPVVAQKCLYGFDVDAAAVELAKIGLTKRCGLPLSEIDSRFPNLRHGNALLELWQSPGKVFPSVFSRQNSGFDLVITNPPWEIEKANSREFFSRFDSEYMSLSKQSALERQVHLLSRDNSIDGEWKQYLAYHQELSSFIQSKAEFQGGGDSNAYKLFLELGYDLLRTNGVMAQIVPSGIYSDKGATALRHLFVERCRWLFLHGYHNHDGIFSIHRSFKFCALGVVKGGLTDSVDCSFLRVSAVQDTESFPYKIETLRVLSPKHLAFVETSQACDLKLIEKLAENCAPLGAQPVSFRREFDMTNDSKYFIERSKAQSEGFMLDCFGHWLKGDWKPGEHFSSGHADQVAWSADGMSGLAIDDIKGVLLPVYEGRMIGQYDWAKKGWLRGKGRRADWVELPFAEKSILPQYLLEVDRYLESQPDRGVKVAYLAVGASTNSRSCIAAMIGDWPCGNAVPVLTPAADAQTERMAFLSALLACLNSFVFDYLLRLRLSANNLNWFILQECLLPDMGRLVTNKELLAAVSELSLHNALRAEGVYGESCDYARRMKLRAFVEAVVAQAYKVSESDCMLLLRGCELDEAYGKSEKPNSVDKGFHRIDLDLPPKFRGPSLFLDAFHLTQERNSKWLFHNLDADDVLFSRKSCEAFASSGYAHAGNKLVSNAMPKPGQLNLSRLREQTTSTDDLHVRQGTDARKLMCSIRNAVSSREYPRKVPSMDISRFSV